MKNKNYFLNYFYFKLKFYSGFFLFNFKNFYNNYLTLFRKYVKLNFINLYFFKKKFSKKFFLNFDYLKISNHYLFYLNLLNFFIIYNNLVSNKNFLFKYLSFNDTFYNIFAFKILEHFKSKDIIFKKFIFIFKFFRKFLKFLKNLFFLKTNLIL